MRRSRSVAGPRRAACARLTRTHPVRSAWMRTVPRSSVWTPGSCEFGGFMDSASPVESYAAARALSGRASFYGRSGGCGSTPPGNGRPRRGTGAAKGCALVRLGGDGDGGEAHQAQVQIAQRLPPRRKVSHAPHVAAGAKAEPGASRPGGRPHRPHAPGGAARITERPHQPWSSKGRVFGRARPSCVLRAGTDRRVVESLPLRAEATRSAGADRGRAGRPASRLPAGTDGGGRGDEPDTCRSPGVRRSARRGVRTRA
jgi:hypothetical protein